MRTCSILAWSFLPLALLAGTPVLASDEAPVRLRLSVARDDLHAAGAVAMIGRYGGDWGVTATCWLRDSGSTSRPSDAHFAAGGDYTWRHGGWRYGGGVVWIDETNEINGTHWNFELLLGYDFTPRFYAELTHYSHGSEIGIRKDLPNWGWNLLGIGYAF